MAEYLVASGSRKISQLTAINAISASGPGSPQYTILPVVMGSTFPVTDGTTNQITVENFRTSVILNNDNVFTQPQNVSVGSSQIILGAGLGDTLEVFTGTDSTGDGFVVTALGSDGGVLFKTYDKSIQDYRTFMTLGTNNGSITFAKPITMNENLLVNGTITARQVQTSIVTASISYESGSTKFGNTSDDTHEFTGSLKTSGSLSVDGVIINTLLNAVTTSLFQRTDFLNAATQSLNTYTASNNSIINRIWMATGSLNTYTSSNNTVIGRIWMATSSLNTYTSSNDSIINRIWIATSSLNTYTASNTVSTTNLNDFTASQLAVNIGIAGVTSSINNFTSSQLAVNIGIAAVTSSLNNFTASQIGVNNVIAAVTSSLNNFTASQLAINIGIAVVTSSLNNFTSSQLAVNIGIAGVTSSLNNFTSSQIGVNNGIAAVTASLNNFTASQIGVNNGIAAVTASLNTFTQSINLDVRGIQSYTASLKSVGLVSSSQQIQNYNVFALTGSANTFYGTQTVTGNIVGQADVQANKFVFTDGVVNTNVGGQKILATNTNILYLYSGTSGIYINNQANDTTIAQFTNAGQLTIGGPGNDQNLVFGGTNSSIYWGSGGPARMYYNVGDIKISSAGATDVLNVKNIGGILVNGGITGSILATNAVVSSSQQITEYNKFAETASANTFYGVQTISGSLNVSGSTIQTGNNTLTGNTVLSGSVNVSGSTTFNGNHILSGTNTITGNTTMSGSILVSGSSDFKNSIFIVTGSSFFTGSHEIRGNSIFSGSINIASGSSYFRAGNKLFNYGQWASLETQSGSADTALAVKLGTMTNGAEGVYIANNGSGLPTRITVENTGLYNIQFSLQLNTTTTETCDFSVWYAMTGSNIANSNTDFSIDKTSGGGNGVAALNFLAHITANDYVELYWSKNTANGQLVYKAAQSTPTRPATPSAIVTVTQIA